MMAGEMMRILAVILARGDGGAFIHENEVADLSPGDRVSISHEAWANGWRVKLHRENAPVDLGAAHVVETLSLPVPK